MSELKSGRNGVKLFSKHDKIAAFINQQPCLPTQEQTRNRPAGLGEGQRRSHPSQLRVGYLQGCGLWQVDHAPVDGPRNDNHTVTKGTESGMEMWKERYFPQLPSQRYSKNRLNGVISKRRNDIKEEPNISNDTMSAAQPLNLFQNSGLR